MDELIIIYILFTILICLFVIRWPFFDNLVNIFIIYWALMILIGIYTFGTSFELFILDYDLYKLSLQLYLQSFVLFSLGILTIRLLLFKTVTSNLMKGQLSSQSYVKINKNNLHILFVIIFFAGVILAVTYYRVGYIPLLAGNYHITKYFQDSLELYIPMRPYYTLAVNLLNTVLLFLLGLIFICKNKRYIYILLMITLLLLLSTVKRGPVLLPFLYVAIVLMFRFKKKIMIMIVPALIFISLLFNGIFLEITLRDYINAFSHSYFVGIRELTRLLSFFDSELLLGKTYIAGILSFIPTELFDFKNKYNYMRYIMYMQGANPDLSGGMRASFIGEALINFDILGVVIVSYILGIMLGIFEQRITCKKGNIDILYELFIIQIIHLGFIGFLENGSSCFLFFLIRNLIYFVLYKLIVKRINVTLNC